MSLIESLNDPIITITISTLIALVISRFIGQIQASEMRKEFINLKEDILSNHRNFYDEFNRVFHQLELKLEALELNKNGNKN